MHENQISTLLELEGMLAVGAMRKREKLWKAAEGRTFHWGDLAIALGGGCLMFVGLFTMSFWHEPLGAFNLAIGIYILCYAQFRRQQHQIAALGALIREIGESRSNGGVATNSINVI